MFIIFYYEMWAHSSVWIEWLPAEQLVEGSNPSGPKSYLSTYIDPKLKNIDANSTRTRKL